MLFVILLLALEFSFSIIFKMYLLQSDGNQIAIRWQSASDQKAIS